ncbi:MAG: hypothetical protein JWN86_4173 [Planctomycetota bacterium]|nr:hypothetical protein [Planctomycetota bacterium]
MEGTRAFMKGEDGLGRGRDRRLLDELHARRPISKVDSVKMLEIVVDACGRVAIDRRGKLDRGKRSSG